MISKFRAWLLTMLADGDMVIINAERMRTGAFRRKEAGRNIVVLNSVFHANNFTDGIVFERGASHWRDAAFHIERANADIVLRDVQILFPKVQYSVDRLELDDEFTVHSSMNVTSSADPTPVRMDREG